MRDSVSGWFFSSFRFIVSLQFSGWFLRAQEFCSLLCLRFLCASFHVFHFLGDFLFPCHPCHLTKWNGQPCHKLHEAFNIQHEKPPQDYRQRRLWIPFLGLKQHWCCETSTSLCWMWRYGLWLERRMYQFRSTKFEAFWNWVVHGCDDGHTFAAEMQDVFPSSMIQWRRANDQLVVEVE